MKLATRCFPPGALPYEQVEVTTRMVAKLFEKSPFLTILPKLEPTDSVLTRTLKNIPGIRIDDNNNISLSPSMEVYRQELAKLDKAFSEKSKSLLAAYGFDVIFLEKYLEIIKKFKSPHAYISLTGPYSLSQILMGNSKEQMLNDKNFRKLFIQAVCVKAFWMIEKIKEYNPTTVPIVILEEPVLGSVGVVKRENEEITVDIIKTLLERTIDIIKSTGAICAVQCMEKCDWQIPIDAGADIISFDAYNNPNNLCIIPDKIKEFVQRGGKINWAIVPSHSEQMIKSLSVDSILKRLYATFDNLILAGVPADYVYNSSLVSAQGDLEQLSVIFAERAVMLSTQLAKRIKVITKKQEQE